MENLKNHLSIFLILKARGLVWFLGGLRFSFQEETEGSVSSKFGILRLDPILEPNEPKIFQKVLV